MDFQTRPDICEYMVSLLPLGITTVLEPTPGEGNLVAALKKKGFIVTAPTDFFAVDRTFDAVVMNPPFTPMKLGYEILFRCMEMSEVVIALMPWLTIINSAKRIDAIKEFGLASVTHLPRNAFPGSRVQTCVLSMRKYFWGRTALLFF